MEKKLELAQLKNYLGTGLKIIFDYEQYEYEHEFVGLDLTNEGVNLISSFGDFGKVPINQISLSCYRLSDLDKHIPELGFVPLEELSKWTTIEFNDDDMYQAEHDGDMYKVESIDELDWHTIQKLFEWNFWPFDQSFFEEGLIIDKLKP